MRSVLFACNMNSVRSPMAEAVARHILPEEIRVGSCGVYQGAPDPFVADALKEGGYGPAPEQSRSFGACDIEKFDRVIALTPEAATEARKLHPKVAFWEVENPTDTYGSEVDLRAAYARLRDQLAERIRSELL
ncbi:arsenate-mycothiol transferase ArsC [Parvularcula maris]|uniref:Low molecular weight phosphatase family protein n=1 Tax=Parvularcula maris TaxID=2965077 RepID=A0A9X2RLH2_9PROT|nr:low molecular weight phosphatase family protein [Parvularcula maris]MCQ8186527.1 low molecular weight phosphatase family protein [Parvularcula maris]